MTDQLSARAIKTTDKKTLHGFTEEHALIGSMVYTDEARAYDDLPCDHETVKHP